MTVPTFRDAEQISVFLDEQLPQVDSARLQLRIAADPELASVYDQLKQTRALLRKLPARRAPRNFTLTPRMAGLKAPTPRIFPAFRFASAFASLLLLLTFAANGLGALPAPGLASAPAPEAQAYGIGGGPVEPESAATAAPMLAAPAPSVSEDAAAAATSTPELAPLPAEPAAKLVAPAAPPEVANQPAALIPVWVQIGLLTFAALAGAAAWFVNRKASADFRRKNQP